MHLMSLGRLPRENLKTRDRVIIEQTLDGEAKKSVKRKAR